jgi:N-acyl-D-aspartate/D-glutamate deacylase
MQKPSGYVATVKRGAVTFEQSEPTGALPGGLQRGGTSAPSN